MTLRALFLILVSMSMSCATVDLSQDDGAEEEESAALDEPGLASSGSYDTCDPPDYNGVLIRCVGTHCSSGPGWCQCDGNYRYCTPAPCSASASCEGSGPVSCSGYFCSVLGPLDNKVCGGVECSGVQYWCPPLPGDLECY
jgi:hypothetical protein